MNIYKRFLKKVESPENSECWEWIGSRDHNGYGRIKVDGKMRKASRVSYNLFIGDIPEGMCVCHKCDNPPCINPEHLFLATRKENMQDMLKKGRGRWGFASKGEGL